MTPRLEPRSAGKLHIGNVTYTGDTFAVEMVFEARQYFSKEDEFKSAALAAAQHFMTLLYQNGYRDHGMPEVKTMPQGERSVMFYITCRASRKTPAIVMLTDKEREFERTNGGRRDPVRDKA
jgi:hypothetical protein